MNQISVLFFATLKDRVGTSRTEIELPHGATVADLRSAICKRYPQAAPAIGSALVAVNREYAFDEDALPQAAEVAIFPPVSGGSAGSPGSDLPTVIAITDQELELDGLLAQITLPTTGAACFFSGMVRAITSRGEPRQTSYLEYEAYRPMAETKLQQVAGEIRRRWPDVEGIAIVQRIGRLAPGTPTVLVACTAAHRDTGVFEAARFGIDRLKEIVPVWKKEVGPEGQDWVEGGYHPTRVD
jgi:molybdopterin synthase catalytic subunit